ncbi:hypothetical protein ACSAGD_07425 [Paramicrobacterium sp. CJ85]|uniref:hypothetical protein n=1 Tax=Paramicrobacterium sp. CJ85 TaxID=3445355 RepID=UPI003F6244AA
MQLGTRWNAGTPGPSSLPDVVLDAVRSVEDELRSEEIQLADWSWTLTWLEGRPIVELDDGTLITYNPEERSATVRHDESESEEDY